jgi:hypothetical protein
LQALPQAPQCWWSRFVFTHAPPHSVSAPQGPVGATASVPASSVGVVVLTVAQLEASSANTIAPAARPATPITDRSR